MAWAKRKRFSNNSYHNDYMLSFARHCLVEIKEKRFATCDKYQETDAKTNLYFEVLSLY